MQLLRLVYYGGVDSFKNKESEMENVKEERMMTNAEYSKQTLAEMKSGEIKFLVKMKETEYRMVYSDNKRKSYVKKEWIETVIPQLKSEMVQYGNTTVEGFVLK